MDTWQFTPYAILYLTAALGSLPLAYFAWRMRPVRGASCFSLMVLFSGVWALGFFLGFFNTDLTWKLVMLRVEYLGIVGASVFWMLFVIVYTQAQQWLTKRAIAMLLLFPAATYVQVLFIEWHDLFYVGYGLGEQDGLVVFTKQYGPGFYVFIGYGYFIMVAGAALLLHDMLQMPRRFRIQAVPLVLILVVMLLPNVLYVTGNNPIAPYDPTSLSFVLIGLIFAISMWRYGFLHVVPPAYKLVFESVTNGVVIVDERARILDVNPAAARLFDRPQEDLLGESIAEALPEYRNLLVYSQDTKELNMVVTVGGGKHHCELQTAPLVANGSRPTGRIILLRDITERVRIEEDKEALIKDLCEALAEVRTLSGLLPICSSCKKIRDDKGYWHQVETYVSNNTEVDFSHCICPECAGKLAAEKGDDPPSAG